MQNTQNNKFRSNPYANNPRGKNNFRQQILVPATSEQPPRENSKPDNTYIPPEMNNKPSGMYLPSVRKFIFVN